MGNILGGVVQNVPTSCTFDLEWNKNLCANKNIWG